MWKTYICEKNPNENYKLVKTEQFLLDSQSLRTSWVVYIRKEKDYPNLQNKRLETEQNIKLKLQNNEKVDRLKFIRHKIKK